MTIRIFCIDDNPADLELLREALAVIGGSLVGHCDPAHAAATIAALPDPSLPDAVVVDFAMPQIDGATWMGRIARQPRFRAIPFIGFTGSTNPRDHEAFLAAGAAEVRAKPVRFSEQVAFVESLVRLVARHRAQAGR